MRDGCFIEFTGKDIATPAVVYNKLAVGNRSELFLVSLVAESQRVKQIRAILCGGAKASVKAAGGKIKRASDTNDWAARNPGNLYPTPEGYTLLTHKLDYGQVHALFLSRAPGFMRVVSTESLWQVLNDPRFTTPILRVWMPYIESCLRHQDILEEAHTFNCTAGILSLTTAQLDDIVSRGLKTGEITIPEKEAA